MDVDKAIGKPHGLWCAFAKFYERHGDVANARVIFDKATQVRLPGSRRTAGQGPGTGCGALARPGGLLAAGCPTHLPWPCPGAPPSYLPLNPFSPLQARFKYVEDLAAVWAEWVEMELRHQNYKRALEVLKRATAQPQRPRKLSAVRSAGTALQHTGMLARSLLSAARCAAATSSACAPGH